jgi:hypothetical protein
MQEAMSRISDAGEYSLERLRSAASSISGVLIDFVESVLDEYQRKTNDGNVVFMGRSSRPLYLIAHTVADDALSDKLVLIDVPRVMIERNTDQDVYRYMAENDALKDHSVTFVDHVGRGLFMNSLERIVRTQSGEKIDVRTNQLLSLDPRRPNMLYRKPWKIAQITKAVLFLANQPHRYRLTGELVEGLDGKLYAPRSNVPAGEVIAANEMDRVFIEEAKRAL